MTPSAAEPAAAPAPLPPAPLPAAAPSSRGVDAAGLERLLGALEALPGYEPHALVLVAGGAVVAAGAWAPHRTDDPALLYSLSKSFTSAALGLAVGRGLVSLDDRLLDHLPDLDGPAVASGLRDVRLRHLAAMSSGHLRDTWPEAVAADPDQPLAAFLALPPRRAPGEAFAYDQSCTHALAAVLARTTGVGLVEQLRPGLLDPLGVGPVAWTRRPSGLDQGFSGLHAPVTAVAALGQLLLARGAWDGRQLLAADWVDAATSVVVATPHEDRPDWRHGYGYQHWASRSGFRGDGACGQFMLVLPEQGAVLALTGEGADMQAVLDVVFAHLPAAIAGPGGVPDGAHGADGAGGVDGALAARLAALAAPLPPGDPEPPADGSGGWDGLVVERDGVIASGPQEAALERVAVGRGGAGGWRLVLRQAGHDLVVPFAAGAWVRGEAVGRGGLPVPLAASGGWVTTAAGAPSLAVEVRLLAAPHRLLVTVDAPTRTARARWATAPLWDVPLGDLGLPQPLR